MSTRPFPEFSGHRYKVTPTKAQPGFPVTDLENHRMAVPLGRDPLSLVCRAHEVAHAIYTVWASPETLKAHKVRRTSWLCAEELRVNTLCERTGLSMSPMNWEGDYQSSVNAFSSADLREVGRVYAANSGAGRRAHYLRAWAEFQALA